MLEFEKMIFDDEHIVFLDKETNKKGIKEIIGQTVLEAKYYDIFNSVGDWAIIVEKETIHNIDIYKYGIINSKFEVVFTPVYGFDACIEMQKIINELYQNKYVDSEIRILINKILNKQQKQPK